MTARPYPQRRPLGHDRVGGDGAPVLPRDAATLLLWRPGPNGPEVLMGKRARNAAFVPDFYVFPGGRIDAEDVAVRAASDLDEAATARMGVRGRRDLAQALALAAVRETFEETGLLLAEAGDVGPVAHPEWALWRERGLAPALGRMRYFGRAITSPSSPIRFHARFFIARAEHCTGTLAGSGELSDLAYYRAADALEELPVVDITEFMLNRLIAYAADPLRQDPRTPVFTYRDDAPFVRFE